LPRPTGGDWKASTEFGELGFTVNPSGTKVTKLIFDVRNWACGPVSGSWTLTTYWTNPLSGWPITNNQFAIIHTRSGYPYTEVYTVNGSFDSTARKASGTWGYSVGGTTCSGNWGPIEAVVFVRQGEHVPAQTLLHQNYPNPFNPSTIIRYELPKSSTVRLSVYDMLGREVSMLVNERKDAGVHEATFDASGLSSGVYLCRLQAGDFVQTRKLLLVR
jgi:hypothetical protein